jgi:hypothetical protein
LFKNIIVFYKKKKLKLIQFLFAEKQSEPTTFVEDMDLRQERPKGKRLRGKRGGWQVMLIFLKIFLKINLTYL